jgi:glucosamine kinase
MMILADSGSTKTNWRIQERPGGIWKSIQTSGINPFYQDEKAICEQLVSEFPYGNCSAAKIYFYGAGCANEKVNEIVRSALNSFFKTDSIEVASDLLAAARALCGEDQGIACILGTGSNSCYYNGNEIEKQVSPLGFILGDEGSGAVLGRKLLADILKNQLPEAVISRFFEFAQCTPDEIMENIYRKPFPNRYAAQFTRFLGEHREIPELSAMVVDEFVRFFRRNVMQYEESKVLPVHFTGSVAWYFSAELQEAAKRCGLKTGKIIQDPIEGLITYHTLKHE